jgi:hypothetical protein
METPETQHYDYTALDKFFRGILTPREVSGYLGHLLHFLVYYQHTEEFCEDYYHIYSEIFELAQVLQNMTEIDPDGNN